MVYTLYAVILNLHVIELFILFDCWYFDHPVHGISPVALVTAGSIIVASLSRLNAGRYPVKRESLVEQLLSSADCSFLLHLSFQAPFLIRSVLLLLTRSFLFNVLVAPFHATISFRHSVHLYTP